MIFSNANKELDPEKIKDNLFTSYECLYKYIYKIVSFEDCKYSFKQLFKIYIISKIINMINDKFLFLIITNIVIFYAPIEAKTDHFLFKARMAVLQTLEGIYGILSCFIPKYEEPIKDKNKF